ncbi:dihydrolipoyllysine-residue acetyltransferase [Leeia sp. TBRC 13508]|uniref:Acetyltransferase component of pyruvate dehydrogenase complex n=1 Tax=Leeia speluncae TaxID=2884804 RepID=A0ABS8D2J1_9NEIS|nr:dihydrolipoyllysine-residue acetyltransferase [Leeia speluncae]MCB6182416.1 dihydrolipoyllysine-residue acetyltransferase [Leeia speluncae]
MSTVIELKVPDIGDYKEVEIIEVLVKVGDTVAVDDSLITLETDKATMEVPAATAGVITAIHVKVGDKVSEGSLILSVDAASSAAAPAPAPVAAAQAPKTESAPVAAPAAPAPAVAASAEIRVPDIGDYKAVDVIEILVRVGDTVALDDSLITLETDKATMEVPASVAGVVEAIAVNVGDKVSEGSLILTVRASGAAPAATPVAAPAPAPTAAPAPVAAQAAPAPKAPAQVAPAATVIDEAGFAKAHASPSVRKFARELGVDLSKVKGSGPKGRITATDVQTFVKGVMQQVVSGAFNASAPAATGSGVGLDLLPWPKVDFSKFGTIDKQPLSRIKKISGANLHRNWVMIPHVTNHDECDITELEAFRVQLNKENEKSGNKVTMLAFMIKAAVAALKKFPSFNSSLDGDTLVMKSYYNIGFAADTPNGLVVPVIKDADKKGVFEIAKEMGDLAKLARDGKLKPEQMQGGCFSISSLGGIGGTYFTPIINAPEVAIMGVCKSSTKPVWDGKQFVPRLMLPLSLSWDHRVIDGAEAARFNAYFGQILTDFRRVML